MPLATANNLQLHYDTFGDPEHPAVLLIMGLGAQMTLWRDEFCRQLAAQSLYVVRFDNRDIGLSEYLDHLKSPPVNSALLRGLAGRPVAAPYSLSDMAQDAVGLLDALGIERAHVCGASMGGMIAQLCALKHPERCLSLISVMSNTGEPTHRIGRPKAILALVKRAEPNRASAAEHFSQLMATVSGKNYPPDRDVARRIGAELFDRAFHPSGFKRQLLAVLDAKPRTKRLRQLAVPTLVIHGTDDPLVRPIGGATTAAAIPNAEMLWVAGMGHRLPPGVWPFLSRSIGRHSRLVAAGLS